MSLHVDRLLRRPGARWLVAAVLRQPREQGRRSGSSRSDPRQDPDVRHSPPRPARLPARGQPASAWPIALCPRRRSPDGRSAARPSPAAAMGAATGSPPEGGGEHDSDHRRAEGLGSSPDRIASSRGRSEDSRRGGAGANQSSRAPERREVLRAGEHRAAGRGPRPAVRPTGACDREPGARPGCGVRPLFLMRARKPCSLAR